MRKLLIALLLGASFLPVGEVSAATMPRPAKIVRHVMTQKKVVAFTFDDGPSPWATPLLLELLKKEGVKATFFIIGQEAVRFPELVSREVQEGHEIGNHGMHHKALGRMKEDEIQQEVADGAASLRAAGAPQPHLYRFPKALSSAAAYRVLGETGYTVVGWSVDPRDYQRRTSEALVADTLKNTKPGDIVIFHDGPGRRQATLTALKTIIPQLKAHGFKFVTVSDLMATSHRKA